MPQIFTTILENLLLGALIIFLGIYYSTQIPFMGDEIVTYYLGSLPSVYDLLKGLSLGADSHGPIYHGINWIWTHIGAKLEISPELWTRIPSIVCITVGLLLLKFLFDAKLPRPIGLLLVLNIITWEPLLRHLGENRSYGWVILLVCFQLYVAQQYINTPKRKYLIFILLIAGLSILSHPMAYAYTMAIVLSAMVFKLGKEKKLDLKPLKYATVGSLAIVPWLVAYLGQIKSTMYGSVNWAPPPTLYDLAQFLRLENILIILILLGSLYYLRSGYKTSKPKPNLFWLMTGFIFVLFPMGLWILSQITNPLFLERYILPTQIGWALIFGGILTTILQDKLNIKLKPFLYVLALGMSFYIINLPIPTREVTGGYWNKDNPWADAGFSDDKYFTENIPVVCESSTTYLPRNFYHNKKRDYILVLDKDIAQKSKGIWLMDFKMNLALKQVDKSQKIKSWDEFLLENKKFYLINENDAKQDTILDPLLYKRTLLNPEGRGNIKLELIEQISP
jgi:hypothetical protein